MDEAPSQVVTASKRGGRKGAAQEKIEKATRVGLLTTAVTSIYSIIAVFAGEHFVLEEHESALVAIRVDGALETLPRKYYVHIKSYFENVAPWVALAIAIYAVTAPRIEQSAAIRRAQREDAFSSNGDGGAGAGDFTDDTRFVYPVTPPVIP